MSIKEKFLKYIDLHIHTKYTKGNGVTEILPLVKKAKEFGMSSLAITDSGTIDGFSEFNKTCLEFDIKPIFGCGFYFAPLGLADSLTHHLVLIAKNSAGLANLRILSNFSFKQGLGAKPRIDFNILKKNSSDLFCLTGGLGGVFDKPFLSGNSELAYSNIKQLKDMFKDNLYLEMQDNGLDNNREMIDILPEVSKDMNISLIVTGGSFYLNPEDAKQCNEIRAKNGNKKLVGDGFYFKSEDDIKSVFKNYTAAIENSFFIANSCNVDFKN